MSKKKNIEKLIKKIAQELLNDEYHKICKKIIKNYLRKIPGAMDRGRKEIWASSIIWAAGSVNFLNDPSFEPYASLQDVCDYFGTNASTVGNKAGEIRKLLKMNNINPDYLLEDSPILDMISSMRVSEDGLIYFSEQEDEMYEAEYLEDDGSIDEFFLQGISRSTIKRSTFFQYEYMLQQMVKKWIEADGRPREISIEFDNVRRVNIHLSCTLTEAGDMDEWMLKNGLK